MYILFRQFTHWTTFLFLHDPVNERAISSKTPSNVRQSKTSINFRYSNLIIVVAHGEAKPQVANLHKEIRNCPTKNVDSQVTLIFSYPYWIKLKCKVLFLYSFEYIYFCLNSWEKKLKIKNLLQTLSPPVVALLVDMI